MGFKIVGRRDCRIMPCGLGVMQAMSAALSRKNDSVRSDSGFRGMEWDAHRSSMWIFIDCVAEAVAQT